MKLNDNDKNELIRKLVSGLEISTKFITKVVVGFFKALINAFR